MACLVALIASYVKTKESYFAKLKKSKDKMNQIYIHMPIDHTSPVGTGTGG